MFICATLLFLPIMIGLLRILSFWLTKILTRILNIKWLTITIISIISVLWGIIEILSLWSYNGKMNEWNIFTSIVCTLIALSVTFTIIISTAIAYEMDETELN